MTKVLVLGATGFIGGHIAKCAYQAGWEVHGFRRDPQSEGLLAALPIQWHNGTLEDYPSLFAAMTGIDFVFHAAASYPGDGNPSRVSNHVQSAISQINLVLQAIREAGVSRLIYTSSLTTIGIPPGDQDRLADERDVYQPGSQPKNGYYESKIAMENLALDAVRAGADIVIMNPSLVLGPGDRHLSTGEIVVAIAKGLGVAVPQGIINIIDVRDVAVAQVKGATQGRSGERYILGGENFPVKEAASIIARAAGVRPPRGTLPNSLVDLYIKLADTLPFIPYPQDHLRGYRSWQGYNTHKAQRELDLDPRPLEETARDSIAWFKQQGYL